MEARPPAAVGHVHNKDPARRGHTPLRSDLLENTGVIPNNLDFPAMEGCEALIDARIKPSLLGLSHYR